MSPERRNGLADFKLDVQPAITEAANSTTEARRHAETRKCKLNRKGRQSRKGIAAGSLLSSSLCVLCALCGKWFG
jgi:hypothetical protein